MINMLRDNVPFSFLNTDGGHVRRKFDILSDICIYQKYPSRYQRTQINPVISSQRCWDVLMLRKFEID